MHPPSNSHHRPDQPQHPVFSRRFALQAGAISLLGLSTGHLAALRSLAGVPGVERSSPPADPRRSTSRPRSAIYIFLSGGLSQLDSFDLKPHAPDDIRGEFKPTATRTPGLHICEHLPMLAARSQHWALVRSLTHPSSDHSLGHHIMLTGRSVAPPGFDPTRPKPTDWPSIAAVAGAATTPRNNLPPAVALPERLVHYSGRTIPGQFAGEMGPRRDPWFIEASAYEPLAYGAYPTYEFDHQKRPHTPRRKTFVLPSLTLPEGVGTGRLADRLALLKNIDRQRAALDRTAEARDFDRYHQAALSLLTDPTIRQALDVTAADPRTLERYGNNSFGWSLLMARRLVEAGVNLVQVNLGNNETWDTHGFIFPHLRDLLFPPTDRALSALLDDLYEIGLLDSTLIVMAGEFGRTPRISTLPEFYKLPGRDHWGHVQTVFFAGGGIRGGQVVGSSDKIAAFPASDPQSPENLAATLYHSLAIPPTAAWHDDLSRPHPIYHASPIPLT